MGWFWQSPPRSPAEGKSAPAPSETPTPPKAQEDAGMDPEIAKFLAQFQTELNGGKEAPPAAPTSQKPSAPSSTAGASPASSGSSWPSWRSTPPAGQDSSSSSSSSSSNTAARSAAASQQEPSGPEAMAASIDPPPTTCRAAFDQAFHCNGLGGQWNAIYRYGELRNCSEQWDDFWFCMRVKSYSPELRAAAYKERYREKDLARYGPGKPSSEDVWVSRDRKVEPGTVFSTPMPPAFDDADVDAMEWSRREHERRQKIREKYGYADGAGPQTGAA